MVARRNPVNCHRNPPQQSGEWEERYSADMAIRLNKAFGGGADTWLRLQMAYDLAQARQHKGDIKVKPVRRRKLDEPRP
jgi:plasmid maintenance system antidote protein VapI